MVFQSTAFPFFLLDEMIVTRYIREIKREGAYIISKLFNDVLSGLYNNKRFFFFIDDWTVKIAVAFIVINENSLKFVPPYEIVMNRKYILYSVNVKREDNLILNFLKTF